MKNIFKFMGIALMACSLTMVSCSKDEETESAGCKVTFGNTSWEPSVAQIYTANYAQYGVNEYIMFKTEESFPYVDMMITGTPGTYEHEATRGYNDEDGYSYYQWQTQQSQSIELYNIEYFENTYASQNYDADWQPVSANLKVNSYDANTLTASFTLNATMYDFYSWNTGAVNDAEEADTKNLEIKVNGYTFTEITK